MKRCKRLVKNGWQARIDPRTGYGIELKRPGGRTFCFTPFTAVYSEMWGRLCYDENTARNNLEIKQPGCGVRESDVWAATLGASSGEGMEQICENLYHDILKNFGIPVPK
jgi:hypothetical protein